ncbi:structural maintenance of chromosomes flexible hinge domain-containing protein 1 isoform X1 [Danio rerio]|uniref:Structural maintenance of chromosomes flexible hinge domain-containing protein 1 isoform X1 n=2 Tax=Danio rerio TaxID=7955 RepID=A0A8M3AUP8_DANRE|nr:structural maintenance of chromosomes flexible hinge domain-containing protein 1 [Danio rerio]|eukprot:XP_009301910.2 structural maintenance of chromosomes flexible hinge domain-containing protein 1 [Danio rerio]
MENQLLTAGAGETQPEKKHQKSVVVYDCRPGSSAAPPRTFDISNADFTSFLQALVREFSLSNDETFVISTTDRKEIDQELYKELVHGKTLQLMTSVNQELPVATQERIDYLPHYHTLVQCGMYEYYASEGQKALPYAFAELIDNALSATRRNTDIRRIEIRLLFDEAQGGPAVVVMDNGCGMTSKQLNNWAVYRLSKFIRENSTFQSEEAGYVQPDPVPRSLNSDISYFGVGGKQAVFYIGQSVRMISKPASSPDVHEFIMSKDDFERKERNKEDIYSGFIRNRKPGDCSHVDKSEEMFLQSIMREEIGKESFTAVVITGIQQEHINYLKQHFILWTRELAHTYHYYIHGVDGNVKNEMKKTESSSNIDIQISLFERSTRVPRIINLREVDNDMQTLYVRSSANTFEFKATGAKDSLVEGLIRYHPFLYDRETFPVDPYAASAEDEDEELEVLNPEGRGKRPIFECFWNGRLIPYTTVSEFPWCERPKKGGIVPLECYNRISGVLFANDRFQVSTNKLTFMDLELQLRDKDTIFNNGQGQRVNIEKEFTNWLKTCHESFDKQVMFQGYISNVTRTDVATKRQFPWAGFEAIQWDGKTYKRGQYVKTVKTKPILYGSILQFLLYGACDGDVYATGGFAQIALEPKELYDEKKVIPISKIDRMATAKAIEENIENELAKLPDQLKITWPEGNAWEDKDAYPAGTPMGPIKVEILNRKGYSISRLPGTGNIKKLVVELTVTRQSPKKDDQTKKDVQTNSHIAVHSTKWEYWFKTMENLTKIGKYTLHLQTKLSDSSESHWVGKKLPNYTLNFSIKEGKAESFKIGQVSSPVLVGVPFSVPLDFRDQFEYSTQPPSGIKPQLECSSLKLSYDGIAFGTTAVINNVRALGKIKQQGKKHTVKVRIPGLKQDIDSFQLALEPGPPHTLVVFPDGDVLSVENGTPVNFKVEVHDECQNITAHPKLAVRCQMMGAPDLPVDIVDCSNTGSGLMLTKPLSLKTVNAEQIFTVKFNIPNHRTVSSVERQLRVLPSTRISRIEVYRQEEGSDDVMVLQNSERIDWTAGDTLGNLYFRLYDEGNRLVSLQPKITSKIKVNWTAKLNAEDLAQGKLPCLGVPTQAQREHFYHVSFQDQHAVNMSFIIVPRPDEPERLRVRLGESTVKMGEVLSGSTYVEVMDQYGNKTDRLDAESVNSLSVSADGLDNEALAVEWQARAGHFCVSGIRFVSGSPGSRELSFQLQRMKEFVRVDVTAGAPAQIKLLEELEMPLQVMNGHGLETPLTMQLCDQWGNASPDQRVNIVLKTRTSQLKIKSSVSSQPVDSKGKACFVLEAISGPKGEHELEFRGFFSRNGIPGPIIKLNLIPDPNKPVKLCVEYDSRVTLCAGDIFPDFMVVVKSEEGSAVKNICPANLSMLLWKGTASGSCPPAAASTLKCSKRKDSEKDDSFCFRDKQIPELAGQYVVQFVLALDQTKHLWSKQIPLNVFANKATKLAPEIPPATPVVSNSNVRANRTLLYSLTLKIMDQYSNVAGEGLDGQVVVTVTGTGDIVIPLFENKEKRRSYSLTNGETVITDLVLLENSPGVDGAEYVLQFSPEIQQTGVSIAPYSLPFRFCNDADHQKVIVTLSKKKDRLSQTIKMFREFFDTNQQLISELECQVRDALHKLNEFKPELKRNGISALSTVSEIEDLINAKKANLTKMENQPRRKCTVPDPFRGSPQVLGKVAHLALVKDDNVAKVISWHLLGDMDCVVTETTSAAKRIYDDTHGRQQVLPLETIFWKPYDKRLPHIRNGSALFRPLGDPVFVKDLLIFPEYAESCNKVFTTLLGDTILIDDLDSANQYRRGVVQNKIQCPTILTRQGERIRCNGKFGGLQNKAPSIEKLRGQVFGAPLPAEYNQTRLQIDLLQQYRVAMQKASTVQADLNSHLMDLQSPIMTQKKQELEEQEVELQEIEKTLARTPEQMSDAVRVKRSLEPESSDTPVLPKRIRRKPLKMDS